MCICVYVHLCMCALVHMCMYTHTHAHVHIYVYMCTCGHQCANNAGVHVWGTGGSARQHVSRGLRREFHQGSTVLGARTIGCQPLVDGLTPGTAHRRRAGSRRAAEVTQLYPSLCRCFFHLIAAPTFTRTFLHLLISLLISPFFPPLFFLCFRSFSVIIVFGWGFLFK